MSNPFKPALEAMAVISTAHVLPATMTWISDGQFPSAHYLNDYGAFIYVPDDMPPLLEEDDETGVPPDLLTLLELAKGHGITWLKLDRDASTFDGIPHFQDAWDKL